MEICGTVFIDKNNIKTAEKTNAIFVIQSVKTGKTVETITVNEENKFCKFLAVGNYKIQVIICLH